MRPEKALRNVKKAFNIWDKTSNNLIFYDYILDIKKLIEKDKIYRLNINPNDYNIPTDFSYNDNDNYLNYISGKFNTTNRLHWLYYGLTNKLI